VIQTLFVIDLYANSVRFDSPSESSFLFVFEHACARKRVISSNTIVYTLLTACVMYNFCERIVSGKVVDSQEEL
jgi:hypothetical protein